MAQKEFYFAPATTIPRPIWLGPFRPARIGRPA